MTADGRCRPWRSGDAEATAAAHHSDVLRRPVLINSPYLGGDRGGDHHAPAENQEHAEDFDPGRLGKVPGRLVRGPVIVPVHHGALRWQASSPASDPLTCLLTRQALTARLTRQLGQPLACNEVSALLLIDFDSFQLTNELFGHRAGDDLLRQTATALRRWTDGRYLLGRTDGDEFAVALRVPADQDLRALACEARTAVIEQCKPLTPQISVGIAIASLPSPTVDVLLKCANAALRDAKHDGGAHITAYRVDERYGSDTADWVLQTLEEERFTLFAQPIVDLDRGEVARQELLLRALDRDGQLVMPDAFIPVAERYGLMPAVDRWVVAHAIGLAGAGARVSINLSAQSLSDVTPLRSLVGSAVRAGVDPTNLMFEITETAAISDSSLGYRALHSLAELGCPLALDDFGAGFGCFSYLKHVPTELVKIDREFITNISSSATDLAITTAIADLTHTLGIEAVAEGVEDHETLRVVQRAGVRYAQGYLFGRPAPLRPITATQAASPIPIRNL